jgi:glycosyltransferase involved in cell wall biosynthesis
LSLSEIEGMSNSIMEAMSYGIPVVATGVGGNLELIRDGDEGWLVPFGEVEGVAQCLAKVAGAPEARGRAGAMGRDRIEKEYSIPRMVERYVALYRELAREGLAEGGGGDAVGR